MKTYISDIIPKIQRFSQKLDNLTLLTNQHWVVIDDIMNKLAFRQKNVLRTSFERKNISYLVRKVEDKGLNYAEIDDKI